jgi:hypothetical protein
MADQPSFDLAAAHRYFSAYCFNQAWELIEKPTRTAQEDAEMLRLSMASMWHWKQRPDCNDEHLSIGYWQTSRIFTLLKQANLARRFGQMSLDTAQNGSLRPFLVAYAYEALARAEAIAGEKPRKDMYLAEARRLMEKVDDPEEKALLEKDLATIL